MTDDLTIRQLLPIDRIQNDCARVQFLLNRMLKDTDELKELGVIVELNEVECNTNEKFLNYL